MFVTSDPAIDITSTTICTLPITDTGTTFTLHFIYSPLTFHSPEGRKKKHILVVVSNLDDTQRSFRVLRHSRGGRVSISTIAVDLLKHLYVYIQTFVLVLQLF